MYDERWRRGRSHEASSKFCNIQNRTRHERCTGGGHLEIFFVQETVFLRERNRRSHVWIDAGPRRSTLLKAIPTRRFQGTVAFTMKLEFNTEIRVNSRLSVINARLSNNVSIYILSTYLPSEEKDKWLDATI